MGLISVISLLSFVFILLLTLFYVSKTLATKPAPLVQVVDKVNAYINQIALWGSVCGVLGVLLTLMVSYTGGEMMIRLLANLMIVLMALPFIFDKLAAKFRDKINPAIEEEAKNLVGWITRQEKYVGYAGAVFCLLLLGVMIR